MPDEVLVSKSDVIKGWKIVEMSDWLVESTWINDRDQALHMCKDRAKSLGANALVNCDFQKGKDTEGNYTFSVFKYVGRPVFVSRKSVAGKENIKGRLPINICAQSLKAEHERELREDQLKFKYYWVVWGVVTLGAIVWAVLHGKSESTWISTAVIAVMLAAGVVIKVMSRSDDPWFSFSPVGPH